MKVLVGVAAAAVIAFGIGIAPAAEAKGCLKGAVVGGIAGHYAGHNGLVGAAAGCAYGRHEANKRQRLERNNIDSSNRELQNGQERM